MKLYYNPASTTSRPVWLFITENKVPCELQVVDLQTGEHLKPEYAQINPSHLVPALQDGDFQLTEGSAILKYLADKIDSPLYPKELKARARVNERMDWFNTQMNRELCYGFVYPQILAHHKRQPDEAHAATIAWGKKNAQKWLQVLNDHMLGADNAYVCGKDITIADYFGAAIVTLGELTGSDFLAYPNVKRWLDRVKQLKTWKEVHQVFDGYAAHLKGTPGLQAI